MENEQDEDIITIHLGKVLTQEQYEERVTGGLFPENAINTKDYLETYFGLNLG